jgi:N-acyl-phosphatidylethanolamine-hydrolysing phospholipase D
VNIWGIEQVTLDDLIRYYTETASYVKNLVSDENIKKLRTQLPVHTNTDWTHIPDNIGGVCYFWIGHSTLMLVIRLDDREGEPEVIRVLTDPVFGNEASPLSYFKSKNLIPSAIADSYKRYTPVPVQVSQLPPIDLVMYSHDHYDHLCFETLRALEKYHKPKYYVPLSFGKLHLYRMGVPRERYFQMDWYENQVVTHGIDFTFVPAQHNSGRIGLDKCRTLWGGWVIKFSTRTKTKKIYFSGDTGYCEEFKKIGELFGTIDLAFIAIGAGEGRQDTVENAEKDRRFLKGMHINAEEAVQVAIDINAQVSVGIHWGTFALTGEHPLNPKLKVSSLSQQRNINFTCMRHGEVRQL